MLSAFITAFTAAHLALVVPTTSQPGPDAQQAAFEAAKAQFKGGDYLAAAAAFEALWEASNNPKHLHYAGLAWATAGEDARAILRWRRLLLDPSATAEDRQEAETYLSGALGRTTTVTLGATPAGALRDAKLELSRDGSPSGPLIVALADTTNTTGEGYVVHLEPGSWTITLHPASDRLTAANANLEIDATKPRLELPLELAAVMSALQLQLTDPGALAAGVSVTLRDAEGRAPDVRLDITDEKTSIPLPVGTWHLRAESPGAAPVEETLAIHAGQPTSYALVLSAPSKSDGPTPSNHTNSSKLDTAHLALGLGISSAISVAAGAALIGAGEARISNSRNADFPCAPGGVGQFAPCRVDEAHDMIGAGSLILGGGLGLGTTAVLAHKKIAHRAWFAPLAIGLAAAIGGATWNGITHSARMGLFDVDTSLEQNDLSTIRASLYPSMLLTGFGGGLIIGSTAALIRGRSARTQSADSRFNASISPRGALVRIHF